jgi:hypothetical protein
MRSQQRQAEVRQRGWCGCVLLGRSKQVTGLLLLAYQVLSDLLITI